MTDKENLIRMENALANNPAASTAFDRPLLQWEPDRWYRAVAPDGTLWCESSSLSEVIDSLRPGDKLQRLYSTVPLHEWRDQ